MWHHAKKFPEWSALDRAMPEYIYSLGMNLRGGLVGVTLVAIILIIAGRLMWKARCHVPLSWRDQTLAIFGFVTACWLAAPQVFENLTLYFSRIYALPAIPHVSFKGVVHPIPGGYLTLACINLPPLVLISLLLTPLLFVPTIRKKLTSSEQQLCVMSAIVSVLWILLLSSSSKQAWRYTLPVASFLYIIASLSLCAVGRCLDTPRLPLILLLLGQAKAVYRGYPNWDLYQSPFAPTPKIAARLGAFHPRTGQLEALNYLITEAKNRQRELRVTLIGDGRTLASEAVRWFGKDAHWIRLGYYREEVADFLLIQRNVKFEDSQYKKYLSYQPIFESVVKEVPVAGVYAIDHSGASAPSTPISQESFEQKSSREEIEDVELPKG